MHGAKIVQTVMRRTMMNFKSWKIEKIVTLQNYMKKIDNGWNSGHIFQIEIILGELIKEYNEVHNSRIETEEKNVQTRS